MIEPGERSSRPTLLCPASPDIQALAGSINILAERIEVLTNNFQNVVRWLLIVVCVIALGRSAIDLGRDFFVPPVIGEEADASPTR